jgi:hypothetical protein
MHAMTTELSAEQQRALRRLAGMMIPASSRYRVPGADDDTILADIVASVGRDHSHVVAVLADLDRRAGGRFADLDPAAARTVAEQTRTAGGPALRMTQHLILACYYRDDRVMRSLDMEPRPPFPRGHEVEQGDWSLLDPVRARPRLYRDA